MRSLRFYISIIIVSLYSCSGSNTSKKSEVLNDPEDIKKGNQVVQGFYEEINSRRFSEAASLMGKNITHEKGMEIITKLDSLLGPFVEQKYVEGSSKRVIVNEKNTLLEITLSFEVSYERGKAYEEFAIELINDSLLITWYNSNIKL